MTAVRTPFRPSVEARPESFRQTLRAEWTKLRTVRGWLVALVLAPVLMGLFGWLVGAGSHSTYNTGPDTPAITGHPYVPIGPGGEAVTDDLTLVHRDLTGDGTITARVDSLTGTANRWAKAGLMIKANTAQGSAYAAIMVTGGRGVRMQYDFTGDIAGPASARWLRLTRSGDTLTGYASTDGTSWTRVGSARLRGLPATVPGGLFATTPPTQTVSQHLGGGTGSGGFSPAVGTFTGISVDGGWAASAWRGDVIGTRGIDPLGRLGFQAHGDDAVTVTGFGDVAPDPGGIGVMIERTLTGAFAALTVVAVLGALFITTEYRRGMHRVTLAASPRRGRVLAAKALVLGVVTFTAGVIGSVLAILVGRPVLVANGNFVYPVSGLTSVRLVAGTALVLAVMAVLGLALGTILRRSAGAVAMVVVAMVLPYLLATAGVLPVGAAQWLLRVTPAAGFAIQQSLPAYAQVDGAYLPTLGFFPLAPWVGFAVLCAYAAAALAVAAHLLRRRDA